MQVLDDRVARRQAIFHWYRAALERPGITFMPQPEGYHSTRWLTALTLDPAQTGVDRQIESRPLWKPMHLQPLYAGAPYRGAGFDESLFANRLCLPSSSDMTDDQQGEVIERILGLLTDGRA